MRPRQPGGWVAIIAFVASPASFVGAHSRVEPLKYLRINLDDLALCS